MYVKPSCDDPARYLSTRLALTIDVCVGWLLDLLNTFTACVISGRVVNDAYMSKPTMFRYVVCSFIFNSFDESCVCLCDCISSGVFNGRD